MSSCTIFNWCWSWYVWNFFLNICSLKTFFFVRIGTLGLVDYDEVEVNNLHRQLLHTEESIGITKSKSAKDALLRFKILCSTNSNNY